MNLYSMRNVSYFFQRMLMAASLCYSYIKPKNIWPEKSKLYIKTEA